jgi:hypothetical protein
MIYVNILDAPSPQEEESEHHLTIIIQIVSIYHNTFRVVEK